MNAIMLFIALLIGAQPYLQAQNPPLDFIRSDIQKVSFVDDLGQSVILYSLYGINKEKHLYHRVISQWNGLQNYKSRLKFYRKVLLNLVYQPEFTSLEMLRTLESSGKFSQQELVKILAVLEKSGEIGIFLSEKVSKFKWLKYSANVRLSNRLLNKIKMVFRNIRHGGLTNAQKAVSALSALDESAYLIQNSAKIYSLFVLEKAFNADLAIRRIKILKGLNIHDTAFTQAINLLEKDLNDFDPNFWNSLVNAYLLNPVAFRDTGKSIAKIGLILHKIFATNSLSPWVSALIFSGEQALVITDHWDHLKVATIAATVYKSAYKKRQTNTGTDLILYCEYLFVKHARAAFKNFYVEILQKISPSYKTFVRFLIKNKSDFMEALIRYYTRKTEYKNSVGITSGNLTPHLISQTIESDKAVYEWQCDVDGDRMLDSVSLTITKKARLILITRLANSREKMKQIIDLSNQLDIKQFSVPEFKKNSIVFSNNEKDKFFKIYTQVNFEFVKSAPNDSRAILIEHLILSGSGLGPTNPGYEAWGFIPFDKIKKKFIVNKKYGFEGNYSEENTHINKNGITIIHISLHWYSFLSHAEVQGIDRAFIWNWHKMKPEEISAKLFKNLYVQTLIKLNEYLRYAYQNNSEKDIPLINEDIKMIKHIMNKK